MKAIELIKDFIFDANLAQYSGLMWYDGDGFDGPSRWAKEKFDAKVVWDLGMMTGCYYLYIYGESTELNVLEWFMGKYAPDVELIDEDGQDIYLWRIDNT